MKSNSWSETIDDVYENLMFMKIISSNEEKESVNSSWWYDSRYGI